MRSDPGPAAVPAEADGRADEVRLAFDAPGTAPGQNGGMSRLRTAIRSYPLVAVTLRAPQSYADCSTRIVPRPGISSTETLACYIFGATALR